MSHHPNDATDLNNTLSHVASSGWFQAWSWSSTQGWFDSHLNTGLHPLKFASALRIAAGAITIKADGTRFFLTPRGRRRLKAAAASRLANRDAVSAPHNS